MKYFWSVIIVVMNRRMRMLRVICVWILSVWGRIGMSDLMPNSMIIECRRPSSRKGIFLRVETDNTFVLINLLHGAFDQMARFKPEKRRVSCPGSWAACVAAAALRLGYPVAVLRGEPKGDVAARIITEPGRAMIDPWPQWPLTHIWRHGTWQVLDLRPESVLSAGPSDAELEAFALEHRIDEGPVRLREMFDLGVLVWSEPLKDGRWRLASVAEQSI